MAEGYLVPHWPAPQAVRSAFTLRSGGVSGAPFASLNLGAHVGDDPAAVVENRARAAALLRLPASPIWLDQVHGSEVASLGARSLAGGQGDAAMTRTAGCVLGIQVADCLPVLLAAEDAAVVAAAHCGWRSLSGGVLEATVRAMEVAPARLFAWLGPAIGPQAFEVGAEVRQAFVAHDPVAASAFTANARGRWQCDLYMLARQRLARIGVRAVFGGGLCTHADAARFFSFRRDGRTGRMAALIWIEPAGERPGAPC